MVDPKPDPAIQAIQQTIEPVIRSNLHHSLSACSGWTAVQQAIIQGIRTVNLSGLNSRAEQSDLLWQIIHPAVHQAFRTIQSGQAQSALDSRTADAIWITIEPEIHRQFVHLLDKPNQPSAALCFYAVQSAIRQALVWMLATEPAIHQIVETGLSIRLTEQAVSSAISLFQDNKPEHYNRQSIQQAIQAIQSQTGLNTTETG